MNSIISVIVTVVVFILLIAGLIGGAEGLVGTFIVVGSVALIYAISFGLTALVVWGIVKCALLVGFTTIGSWTIAFSWPLVGFVWLAMILLRSIFSISIRKN